MDTSNNQKKEIPYAICTIEDMERSSVADENEMGKKMETILEKVVGMLKPILKYVTMPLPFSDDPGMRIMHVIKIETDCLRLPDKRILFLEDDGRFFSALRYDGQQTGKPIYGSKYYDQKDGKGSNIAKYKQLPFDCLLGFLQSQLETAKRKREEHLRAIAERQAKLDQILKILKS
jgi:hypothetical protein